MGKSDFIKIEMFFSAKKTRRQTLDSGKKNTIHSTDKADTKVHLRASTCGEFWTVSYKPEQGWQDHQEDTVASAADRHRHCPRSLTQPQRSVRVRIECDCPPLTSHAHRTPRSVAAILPIPGHREHLLKLTTEIFLTNFKGTVAT